MAEPELQTQQSWAAWFLDAYASSGVTSLEDDLTDDSAYESMSPTMSEASAPETSPYGPYVRTGRGGAGNFTWQSQQPADLEAQKPSSLREKRKAAIKIDHIDTSIAVRDAQARKTSQYVRVGRGGAGNMPYVQSNEPQASPTFATLKSPTSANSPVVFAGRGGAGNFGAVRSASAQTSLEKERREQAEMEKTRERAELEVQHTLQLPSQAYTRSRRRSAMPDDVESPAWP
ncbi:hypothetical protein LTS08_005273 [Lithohypha guttulata]|uniref:Uncharacterized protein n=1 Tax=Lithohypha guttulata TaxID=1690604 RepID=A0AAN7T6R6_9EURO|nr:hypothetical protein LTR05_001697 [Lithohypha guttulata]KAK5100522.1 hypothetical protein LTS08_005273 [Lithohypha guttulata]